VLTAELELEVVMPGEKGENESKRERKRDRAIHPLLLLYVGLQREKERVCE